MLREQLTFHWDGQLRPRLAGLTDDEYFWEPVPECWTVRRDADGAWTVDWHWPEPQPPPFTTIAWRIVHIGRAIGIRTNTFFPQGRDIRGSDEPGPDQFDPSVLPGTSSPEPDGLTYGAAMTLLAEAARRNQVVGIDLVELAPNLDPTGNSALVAARLLVELLGVIL